CSSRSEAFESQIWKILWNVHRWISCRGWHLLIDIVKRLSFTDEFHEESDIYGWAS
ncbi:hypothetical protein TorRG33x02_167580, partial [Trema orientale]